MLRAPAAGADGVHARSCDDEYGGVVTAIIPGTPIYELPHIAQRISSLHPPVRARDAARGALRDVHDDPPIIGVVRPPPQRLHGGALSAHAHMAREGTRGATLGVSPTSRW
jgi:hypothetical protein